MTLMLFLKRLLAPFTPLLLLIIMAGCIASGPLRVPVSILSKLPTDKPVAVSLIHSESTGNITQLGNRFRDDIEITLKSRGYDIKPRKDLVMIIDDAELSGDVESEKKIWEKVGADHVITGSYTLTEDPDNDQKVAVRINTKAYAISTTSLVDGDIFSLTMDKEEARSLDDLVLGNVFQNKFKSLGTHNSKGDNTPFLEARLNRSDTCYRPGEDATIKVDTEKGVYLYIFCISCDGNVTILHPNDHHDNVPLDTNRFTFPPKKSPITGLCLSGLEGKPTCRETFKIIASHSKRDFSFLPFPENQIFRGSNGTDINKISHIIGAMDDYTQTQIHYRISDHCPQE